MADSLNLLLISGWAIPANWLRLQAAALCPQAVVQCVYPQDPFSSEEAERLFTTHPADVVIGYSLGSLWLLHHRKFLNGSALPVLMAPILAFPKESGLGGKIPKTQLEFFLRNVGRTKELATVLSDFLALGEIVLPDEARREMPGRDALLRGLEFLRDVTVTPDAAQDCPAVLGDRDPFTDLAAVKQFLPNLRVIDNCGHRPEPLLSAVFQHPLVHDRLAFPASRKDT